MKDSSVFVEIQEEEKAESFAVIEVGVHGNGLVRKRVSGE